MDLLRTPYVCYPSVERIAELIHMIQVPIADMTPRLQWQRRQERQRQVIPSEEVD